MLTYTIHPGKDLIVTNIAITQTVLAKDLEVGMCVKYLVTEDTFEVGTIVDTYSEPLGFIVYNNGHSEIESASIIEVIWDGACNQPYTRWTGGTSTDWVKVVGE